jgi:hypothetical protein
MRKVLAVISGLLALTSLLFVFAALDDLIGGDSDTGTGILIGLLIFFGGVTAAFGAGAVALWRKKAFDPATAEATVLQLAAQRGGLLTVAEVAIGLQVPLLAAKEALDHLVVHGAAETRVSEGGELVYAVRGLLTAADKAGAAGLLEPRR